MEIRPLGKTGLAVSALGFGCGAVGGLMVRGDAAEQRRTVETALGAGIRYFDTAPGYGDGRSEENLGRVLHGLGSVAADVIVGTKVRVDPATATGPGAGQTVAHAIRESAEASLRRLRRERVHLFQLHNRIAFDAAANASGGFTPDQVLGPVLDGLRAVRDAGMAEHVGITATGDPTAVRSVVASGVSETAQVYFNALNPSAGWPGLGRSGTLSGNDFDGLIDRAAEHGVGVIIIRSLAAGAVAASDVRHANAGGAGSGGGERYEDDLQRAQALSALAADLGFEGPVELALRFALSKPGVSTVIVGFSNLAQLTDALRWAERGALPGDALERVLDLHRPTSHPGH
ncbi:MAG: hypothetical protein AVDCRST_MAG77-772 [uncultured Chloroflexi bacterium]|uniref:NADP-dependent oxidoreductase domain-containing protein n=1 Tax=uncultured Chloroflexota bacterium TaxID=166587 RepID=A0A6J4HJ51_9CHLR|nr:MAG: hypothetical protein AVDCRST_MAG77-772 [uncultured Chloroflexota bacterium]